MLPGLLFSKKNIYTAAISASILFVGFGFQNCAETTFSEIPTAEKVEQQSSDVVSDVGDEQLNEASTETPQSPDETTPPPTIDTTPILSDCQDATAQGHLVTQVVSITFENTRHETNRNQVCEFGSDPNIPGSNGNLGMLEGRQQARYEQNRYIELPEGAVLCDLSLQMDRNSLHYDDMFYMSFNGQVIASNSGYAVLGESVEYKGNLFPQTGLVASSIVTPDQELIPTYQYAWSRLAGSNFFNSIESDYCLGEEQGLASCAWPKTQKTGDFIFDYDSSLLMALGSLSSNGTHEFKFAITGDNDPNTDCFHEGFSFEMEVQYFVPSSKALAQSN